jgi:hypothetical protein
MFSLQLSSIRLKIFAWEYFSLLDLFALHSLRSMSIKRIVCAVCKDIDVVLLSLLQWCVGFSTLLD